MQQLKTITERSEKSFNPERGVFVVYADILVRFNTWISENPNKVISSHNIDIIENENFISIYLNIIYSE